MKNNTKSQVKLTKQEKEHLSNKTVLLSSFALLYGLLLLFFQKMCYNTETVIGALEFMGYLKWGALIVAMGCAAWGAYREKKDYYIYCAMSFLVFVSLYSILDMGQADHAYIINFIALAIAFVLVQVYYTLRANNKFTGQFKIAFLAVTFLSALFLIVALLEPEFWNFLRSIIKG